MDINLSLITLSESNVTSWTSVSQWAWWESISQPVFSNHPISQPSTTHLVQSDTAIKTCEKMSKKNSTSENLKMIAN